MAEPTRFKVLREHLGDQITDDGSEQKLFVVGDTRKAFPGVVADLVKSGVLEPMDSKADQAPIQNKAQGSTPANKAQGSTPANKAISGLKPKG